MQIDLRHSAGARILLVCAAFVVVVAGMRAAEPILVPFLLSVFIAIICAPPLFWLQRRGLSTGLALLVVVLGVLLAGLLLGALVGSSVDDFSRDLPVYQDRLRQQVGSFSAYLQGFGIHLSEQLVRDYFDPAKAMKLAAGMCPFVTYRSTKPSRSKSRNPHPQLVANRLGSTGSNVPSTPEAVVTSA